MVVEQTKSTRLCICGVEHSHQWRDTHDRNTMNTKDRIIMGIGYFFILTYPNNKELSITLPVLSVCLVFFIFKRIKECQPSS